jgi:hypothetical protein
MTRVTSFPVYVCTLSNPTRIYLTPSVHSKNGTVAETGIPPSEIPVHLRVILVAGSDTSVSSLPLPFDCFITHPRSRTQSDSCCTTSRECPTSNAISAPRSSARVRQTGLTMRKCRC